MYRIAMASLIVSLLTLMVAVGIIVVLLINRRKIVNVIDDRSSEKAKYDENTETIKDDDGKKARRK
jgi:inner membrane protein involved in colicin E2 resistance